MTRCSRRVVDTSSTQRQHVRDLIDKQEYVQYMKTVQNHNARGIYQGISMWYMWIKYHQRDEENLAGKTPTRTVSSTLSDWQGPAELK